MSKHLSADQMAEWMAGVRAAEQESHMRDCPECRLALEEALTALGDWRATVHAWSDREYQLAQHRTAARQSVSNASTVWRWATGRLYWTAGVTTACALAAMLAWHNGAPPARTLQDAASSAIMRSAANGRHGMNPDAVLMRQVDREVSQTVPDAMAPLMALVSWDGEPLAEGTTPQQESSKQTE